ncbi:hypothetical protein MACK_001099 [Theileria orientalis]|uniref:Uncharacterized protein n=1 Tax=Theileria orientalis TaxID=68886 RepID=A0A976MC83_THEOR|nr:hypothetical protein MACK_001099 [Theileria orientalis]
MNFSALYLNLVASTLLFASKCSCLEEISIDNEHTQRESEPKLPDLGSSPSEEFKYFQDPASYNNDGANLKVHNSDLKSSGLESVEPPSDVKFYALDPNGGSRVVEINSDKYTVRQNANNKYKFEYEFAKDAHCVKVKCDNSTIWRSGDFKIDEAKFIIYNTENDRITIRDDERYVTYRLVDDALEQQSDLDLLPSKEEPTDLGLPPHSSVTYVTYVNHPVKVRNHRALVSGLAVVIITFTLLMAMLLMLVKLLLLVLRLYKVVDQIKVDVERTDTKVVL